MFDSFLPFTLLTVKYESDQSFHIKTYVYRVKTRLGNYIVLLEEYTDDVFVIKFYPAQIKNRLDKFQVVINNGAMQVVVGTMLKIMLYHFSINNNASFGFIASPSIIGSFTEAKHNNQRFRIYRQIMLDFFSDDTFIHFINEKNSAYLMINLRKDVRRMVQVLQERFSYMYPDLLDLEFTSI